MNKDTKNITRAVSFILVVAIGICPAVFVPSSIEMARKSIIQSLGIKNLNGFTIQKKISYTMLQKLKSQNDNIDYLFGSTLYAMNILKGKWGNGAIIYDEVATCAASADKNLLGSRAKSFAIEGRLFNPVEQEYGRNSAMVTSYASKYVKNASLRICSLKDAEFCTNFNVIGTFKRDKEFQCDIIIPYSSLRLFKEHSVWSPDEGEIYGSVKDLLYVKETVQEIFNYLNDAESAERGGSSLSYGVNSEMYMDTVKSLGKLTLLSVIIYIFLIVSASFGILNYVLVAVSARKIEIGLLLVSGFTRRRIFLRLAWAYFSLCVVGAALGFAAAMILNFKVLKGMLQYNFHYYDSSVGIFITVFALTLAICFCVCIYAASVIASKPPADLLRTQ